MSELVSTIDIGPQTIQKRSAAALPPLQVIPLFILLAVLSTLIFATIQNSPFSSVMLLFFVSISGLVICRRMQISLNDPALRVLGYFWLIKLGMTFVLLYAGWIPQLDFVTSSAWGYDPQRYYLQAQQLIDNNWSPSFISLKYVGILYYYAAIFFIFGQNPVVPALINIFVTLIATLYLIKVGYEIKGQRSSRDWTLAFALLLPEMLWYDVMTSRETILSALLLFVMLTAGRYLSHTARIPFSKVLIIFGVSVVAIAAIRTSMLLPLCSVLALMVLVLKPQRESPRIQRIILVIAAAAALIVGPIITEYLGGDIFHITNVLKTVTSVGFRDTCNLFFRSENSIGSLLRPDGPLQAILFLPIRMILYLVAPLPMVFVSLRDLIDGNWGAWQHLFTVLASVINVLVFPYALASLVQAIKTKKVSAAPLVFHISYWVTFMSIAGGNFIIHERYRTMVTLLLWVCAWLGANTCSKQLIIKSSKSWYGLLCCGALFYFGFKV